MKNCRVRHLQIRAQAESAAHHTALCLEDALRIASLPAEQSRVVIVRALALGKLTHQVTSAQLALRIEQRLQQLPHDLVHATAPTAAMADAVYFSDDAEPVILLALRIARHEPVQHWFWPLAVQAWHPHMAPAAALRLLLRTVTASSAGVAALVRMIHTLRAAGSVQPLFAALQAEDGLALLHLCGWRSLPALTNDVSAYKPMPAPQPNEQLLIEWLVQWGVDDARTQWLANLLLVMAQPARLCTPDLSQHGRAWIEQIAAVAPLSLNHQRITRPHHTASLPAVEQRPIPMLSARPPGLDLAGQLPVVADRSPPAVPDSPQPAPADLLAPDPQTSPAGALPLNAEAEQTFPSRQVTQRALSHPVEPPTNPKPPRPASQTRVATLATSDRPLPPSDFAAIGPSIVWVGEWQATTYAGLFFLLPVLRQLGIYEWLQANPAWIDLALPRRILAAICQQLGVPVDDPIWAAVAFTAADDPGMLPVFSPPPSWATFADGLNAWTNIDDTSLQAAVQHWVAALNTWCEQVLKLPLTTIVQRPGWISMTSTHIDLCFALQQTDLQIRRAGLDIDPGWVVWFGRVVLFHYEDR